MQSKQNLPGCTANLSESKQPVKKKSKKFVKDIPTPPCNSFAAVLQQGPGNTILGKKFFNKFAGLNFLARKKFEKKFKKIKKNREKKGKKGKEKEKNETKKEENETNK